MKKLLLPLLLLPIIANAENKIETHNTNSLQITSMNTMEIPEEFKKEFSERASQIKQKGYYETKNDYGQFLLNIKKNAPQELRAYRNSQNKYDTHLKENSNNIKLSVQFKKLPLNDSQIIGYAAVGTYVKSPEEGWTGIKTFFETTDIGICAYELSDLKLSNGSITLPQENVKYLVNKKPTTTVIEGNKSTAFTYSVIWYDGLRINTLDCANTTYSNNTINKVIALANKIDKS